MLALNNIDSQDIGKTRFPLSGSTQLIQRLISEIDKTITQQLDAILQHPQFKKLEASWRALYYLVGEAAGNRNVKIKLLNASWSEISKDLNRALEFDQSHTFYKIYSCEFGSPGGEPYGLLIGDYEVTHKISNGVDDITTLRNIAQIAACAFVPFVTGVSSEFFGIEDFTSLNTHVDLQRIFQHQQYRRWKALQENSDSKYLGLTFPNWLVRLPYKYNSSSAMTFCYDDSNTAGQSSSYLWANASYCFAAVVIRSYVQHGWFAALSGADVGRPVGGMVSNILRQNFGLDRHNKFTGCGLRISLTEIQESILSKLGFMALIDCKYTSYAAYYNVPSVKKPNSHLESEADQNEYFSLMLSYTLCICRFAHYIKVIIRDRLGRFNDSSELENFLQNWLVRYVSNVGYNSQTSIKYPLKEARISLEEISAKPGHFRCVIYLTPQYQLRQVSAQINIASDIEIKS